MPRKKATPGTKSKQLNIYCLLPAIQTFSDALKDPQAWPSPISLTIASYPAMLYGKTKPGGKPDWVFMLESGITSPAASPFSGVKSTRPSALLIIKIRHRFFALAFGSGHTYLASDSWEPRFGLRIALNLADNANLQQAAFKSHQGRTFTREISASRLSGFYDFGYDGERDFVRRITAKLKNNPLGVRITGKDSVSLVCPASLQDLPRKCRELHILFRSKKYQLRFPDVDQIIPVSSQGQKAALELELDNQLLAGNHQLIHFAYPDIINYDDYTGFRLGSSANVVDDLDAGTLQAELGVASLTVTTLKDSRHQVALVDNAGADYGQVSLFRCCIAEVTLAGETFLLSEGEWHRLEKNYVNALNTFINSMPSVNALASVPRKGQASEDAYLMALKPLATHGFVVAHKEMVPYGGGRSSLEVSDLLKVGLTPNRWQLIHVKGTGGGAEFGHLTNQVFASAEALTDPDSAFGVAALTKLTPQFQTNNVPLPIALPNRANEYELIFVLFAPPGAQASDVTTLFGRIAFRRVVKLLRRYDFEVKLDLLPP